MALGIKQHLDILKKNVLFKKLCCFLIGTLVEKYLLFNNKMYKVN